MVLGNSSPSDRQVKVKQRMEKHASENISEVSESNHALEDAEQIIETKLENAEFEAASKVFSELRTLELHCKDNGFDEEAKKWEQIVEKFRDRAEEILEKKMEECREEIEEAEQIEDKVHEQMANHELAEGVTGSPVANEFKAIKRDLADSKEDIEAVKTLAHGFGLERKVQKNAHGLEIEWNEAKQTLNKLAS